MFAALATRHPIHRGPSTRPSPTVQSRFAETLTINPNPKPDP